MTVKLSDLLNQTKSAAVDVGGATVNITWRYFWDRNFTPDDWERFKELTGQAYFAEVLPRMVTEWDIVDGDEKPVPVTADAIREHDLPVRFLALVEQTILGVAVLS